ncbi:MAG: GNAT family N-acetyltransferase [Eubacteriales bacterium]
MKTISMQRVKTPQQIETTAQLADRIWHQHYDTLLGVAQVDYMVELLQSVPAITRQLEQEGYEYYLMELDGQTVGFLGIVPGKEGLFLSKIYVDAAARRQGVARRAVEFCEETARQHKLGRVWLTVNRHNSGSIAAYQAMGFVTIREEVADIGGGYVMDDYIMEKQVQEEA